MTNRNSTAVLGKGDAGWFDNKETASVRAFNKLICENFCTDFHQFNICFREVKTICANLQHFQLSV